MVKEQSALTVHTPEEEDQQQQRNGRSRGHGIHRAEKSFQQEAGLSSEMGTEVGTMGADWTVEEGRIGTALRKFSPEPLPFF